MFGALNRFISVLDRGLDEGKNGGPEGAFGFQVLRNNNEQLPLEPWFDFIIGINGRTLVCCVFIARLLSDFGGYSYTADAQQQDNGDPYLFATEVKNCAGNAISLGIWSANGQRIRETYVQVPRDAGSLGLSLQWAPVSSTEDVWHILDVASNSPADVAGLLPYADYVIGSPEGLVRGEAGLGELVEQVSRAFPFHSLSCSCLTALLKSLQHIDQPLILYVHNNEYNLTRPVTITPSRSWGGQGLLGCTLGFGALHRIPAPLDEPVQQPGETMFDYGGAGDSEKPSLPGFPPTHDPSARPDGNGFTPITPAAEQPPAEVGGEFLVPANIVASPLSGGSTIGPPPKSAAGRKGRPHHHHHAAGTGDIDDYFKEGEEKSRQEDYGTSPQPGSAVPPPPKMGSGHPPPPPGKKADTPRAETRSPAPVEAGDSDS